MLRKIQQLHKVQVLDIRDRNDAETMCYERIVRSYLLARASLLYSTLLYSTLLYSTVARLSTLLYSTLLYSTLLNSTLLNYYYSPS
jgi:hypothetical protein